MAQFHSWNEKFRKKICIAEAQVCFGWGEILAVDKRDIKAYLICDWALLGPET